MRRQIIGSLLAFAAASAMAADASAPAASTSAPATPNTSTSTSANGLPATAIKDTVPAKPENPNKAFRGYKLVKKNGVEKYCRRQPVLGSRTKTTETCLTLEEMGVMRETGQDVMDRLGRMPGTGSTGDQYGGMTNSATTPMQ